jgi:hypothetical protein
MTVSELRQFITTDIEDSVLEAKLQALELLIRAYTNNNFQKRAFRAVAVAMSSGHQLVTTQQNPFKAGDTLQITDSELNAGLVNVRTSSNGTITVKEELYDESGVIITKVVYPADVKMGVANLMKWEIDNRDKVGVASETISRHSVTYFNMDGDNSLMGYPKSLLGFLKPYMKARFGQGV